MISAMLERTGILSLARGRRMLAAAISPDGERLFGVTDHVLGGYPALTVWEASSGKQIAAQEPPKGGGIPLGVASAVALSGDGLLLAIAFGAAGGGAGLGVWSTWSLDPVWFRGPAESGAVRLRSAAFSPHADWLAGAYASLVKGPARPQPYQLYWFPAGEFPGGPGPAAYRSSGAGPISAGRVHHRPLEHEPRLVAYSPRGSHVAVSYVRGALKGVVVWSVESGAEVARFEVEPKEWAGDPEMPVDFSPDGRVVATRHARGRDIALWDWNAGSTQVLAGHQKPVTCFAFQPGGRLLASGSTDGSIHLWDWITGTPVTQLAGRRAAPHRLQLSPDGTRLFTVDTKAGIEAWRLA